MEKLAIMIQERVGKGDWHPFHISNNGPPISHLFFADDYLLMVEAKCGQVKMLKEVLDQFCLALGLKVNMHKSIFFASKNIPRRRIGKFTSIIGFHNTSNLGKYLGFPLLTGKVKNSDFSFILDRIHGRLQGWKNNDFSLAKSVLNLKS